MQQTAQQIVDSYILNGGKLEDLLSAIQNRQKIGNKSVKANIVYRVQLYTFQAIKVVPELEQPSYYVKTDGKNLIKRMTRDCYLTENEQLATTYWDTRLRKAIRNLEAGIDALDNLIEKYPQSVIRIVLSPDESVRLEQYINYVIKHRDDQQCFRVTLEDNKVKYFYMKYNSFAENDVVASAEYATTNHEEIRSRLVSRRDYLLGELSSRKVMHYG